MKEISIYKKIENDYMCQHVLRIAICSCLIWFQSANSQEDQRDSSFIRFVPGQERWSGELQTAIVSYQNNFGVTVNLVSAVHLADVDYYAALNDYFLGQDAVLYELVANAEERPTSDAEITNVSAISYMQRALGNFLNISFQLEQIDYSSKNFIHADLNPEQLSKIMNEKNQNFFSMFLNLAVSQQMAEQAAIEAGAKPSSLNMMSILKALIMEDRAVSFKYLFAQELGRSDGLVFSPEIESELTILGDRNLAAINVLGNVLEDSAAKLITIFYGAAHMPGIERGLIARFGFKKNEKRWVTAWEIP